MAETPHQRPRRAAQPKLYSMAEDYDFAESDLEEEEEAEYEHDASPSHGNDDEEDDAEDEGDDEEDDEADEEDDDEEDDDEEEADEEEADEADEADSEDDASPHIFPPAAPVAPLYHLTSKWQEPPSARYTYQRGARDPRHDLTLYELHRKPRRAPPAPHRTASYLAVVGAFQCIICWSTLTRPKLVRACLHRFCEDCIEKSLRMGRNECPVCRVFVPSKRNLASDEGCEALIQNLLGPTLRALSDEENENDDNDNDDDHGGDEVPLAAAAASSRTTDEAVEYDEDGRPRRRRGSAARPSSTSERWISRGKRLKIAAHAEVAAAANPANDPAWMEAEEEEIPTPSLYDFCLKSMDADLPALELPYIRISGDATVATLLRFLQSKLAVNVPLIVSPGRTRTGGGRRKHAVHVDTRLSSVGAVTQVLYYLRASKTAVPKKTTRHVPTKPSRPAVAAVAAAPVGES